MDPKEFENKFKDLELVPKRNKKNAEALNTSVKPQKSLKDIQQKYAVGESGEKADSGDVAQGKDKDWMIGHFMPKNKGVDSPLVEKLRMFDEEGNETAAEG